VTASLPPNIQETFARLITTEYTTVDEHGQPITWPVTPYYQPGAPCIDVTTGLGYPKKAADARINPKVSLLFSDATGSGLADAPLVLVQGTAEVDDHDLDFNRERYARELAVKLPHAPKTPRIMTRMLSWYYTRIYVHVRPERIYAWPAGDLGAEPELYDTRLEEVRSGHYEEPDSAHAQPEGGASRWDERLEELGRHYRSAVLSLVAPDGFPFSVRVPVAVDAAGRRVRIEGELSGVPLQPGLACLTAHEHPPDFSWQRNFQVRGDLVRDHDGGWSLLPHRLIGGFEMPPGSLLARARLNLGKMRRFQATAKRELSRRRSVRSTVGGTES